MSPLASRPIPPVIWLPTTKLRGDRSSACGVWGSMDAIYAGHDWPDYQITPILKPLESTPPRLHRDQRAQADPLRRTRRRPDLPDRHQYARERRQLRISCDQELAQAIGSRRVIPRSPGHSPRHGVRQPQDNTLSWSRSGTPIPAENRPHVFFDQLFRPETPDTLAQREAEFARRASVLDSVRAEAKALENRLGQGRSRQARRILHRHSRSGKEDAGRKGLAVQAQAESRGARVRHEQGLDPRARADSTTAATSA
jgi:hypothetical protein